MQNLLYSFFTHYTKKRDESTDKNRQLNLQILLQANIYE